MKNLLFRAWNDEWDEYVYSDSDELEEKRDWYPFGFMIGFSHYPHTLDNTIIEQYTGLQVHNNEKVFEGDILQDPVTREIVYVAFDSGSFWARNQKTSVTLEEWLNTSSRGTTITIIGNVNQDRELLQSGGEV